MKIRNINKCLSLVLLVVGFGMSMMCGAEYWQGMVAGALFGIWSLLVGVEE